MSYFPKKRGMGTAKVRKVFPGSTAAEYVVLNGKLALGPGHRIRTTKGKPAEDKK
ncbi:MAG: hypothetical protein HY553_03360 [Elusimicrobia bacterium]|nr:hypothetical protein [Elusimicrobiota bacterium]